MMIPILNYPDTDGARYSRTSVDMNVVASRQTRGGVTSPVAPPLRIEGWTGLGYSRELKRGKSWGHSKKPQTRTGGRFTPAMSLSLFMEDWILLENYLRQWGATVGLGPFQQSFFLNVTAYERALGTTSWQGVGCQVEKEEANEVTQGSDDQLEVKLTLDVMDVLRDGFSAVYETNSLGQVGVAVSV